MKKGYSKPEISSYAMTATSLLAGSFESGDITDERFDEFDAPRRPQLESLYDENYD